MKEYKFRFHTDYIDGFIDSFRGDLDYARGKFAGPGNITVGSKGVIVRGHYGTYSDRLLDYVPVSIGALAGIIAAMTAGPYLAKTASSLTLVIALISIAVILTATVVFELARYLVLTLFFHNTLVTVSWDDITSFCYTYPHNDDLEPETSHKVLAIAHTAMLDCSPIMLSGKNTTTLLKKLREELPGKEKRPHSRRAQDDHCIRLCPSCGARMQIPVKPPQAVGRCNSCKNRFQIGWDPQGNLMVSKMVSSVFQLADTSLENYYRIIGVSPSATAEEIRSAYRKRIREYHPDKVATLGDELRQLAESKTRMINEAYRVLSERGLLD